jgi:hypothetical protein
VDYAPSGLALLLRAIEANDEKYIPRYGLVLQAVAYAHCLGLKAGFRLDPAEPEWPVAFIELPQQGQVSWHIPQHPIAWDGHTTEEKYQRIERFINDNILIPNTPT